MLGEVKRKEGEAGRGMQGRRAHVQGGEMKVVLGEGVAEAMRELRDGGDGGWVVMLVC